ncbi:MAG: metal-dependent transcriptional regulator [Syntrophomonadaceae bacterium]|nr:metal-dependent transcriptional regulator [Syntrophomonadaceae bacterium]
MQVGETIENYLETIFMLLQKQDSIRSIDVVNEMGYSKPTISVMMKQLREGGFIEIDESGYITLTNVGLDIAKRVYERHVLLTEILIKLGVTEEVAHEDACKVEHQLSKESFARIKEYYLKHK